MEDKIDKIRETIELTVLKKGTDNNPSIVIANHPQYPEAKIQINKIIVLDKPITFDDLTITAIGLTVSKIPDNPDHYHLHYKVKDKSENIFWTMIGEPCKFKCSETAMAKILNHL